MLFVPESQLSYIPRMVPNIITYCLRLDQPTTFVHGSRVHSYRPYRNGPAIIISVQGPAVVGRDSTLSVYGESHDRFLRSSDSKFSYIALQDNALL